MKKAKAKAALVEQEWRIHLRNAHTPPCLTEVSYLSYRKARADCRCYEGSLRAKVVRVEVRW